MARLESTFSVMFVLFSSVFVVSTSFSVDYWDGYGYDYGDTPPTAPSPVSFRYILSPSYQNFVEDCAKKLKAQCKTERYAGIVEDRKISFECCAGIVKMGIECHYDMTTELYNKPELQPIVDEIGARSDKIWKECVVAVTEPLSPSPTA